jgi:hypothetical protein
MREDDARHVTYAATPESVTAHRVSRYCEGMSDGNYRPWAIARVEDRHRPAAPPGAHARTRPSFDKTIENDEWKRPAVGACHRAYMRDEESSTASPPDARGVDDDHYTAKLRSVAHEARRKREARQKQEAMQLAVARGVRQQAPPAQTGSDRVFVQGVLASEIGLVANAACRRGPIIRPNPQDLELAGCHSAFGYVSSQLYATAELEDAARNKRALEYRLSLREQVSSDIIRRERSKVNGEAERKHEEEVRRLERVRLERIRGSKLKMLAAEGVKAEHMALLANYPI